MLGTGTIISAFRISVKMVIHVVRIPQANTEGGSVRDHAFWNYFADRVWVKTIPLHNNKLQNIMRLIPLIACRNRTILLHISASGFPIFNNTWIGFLACFLYLKWIRYVSTRNYVFLEFNDLFVEQAKDLRISIPVNYAKIESKIFSMPIQCFIFASDEMRIYAARKYDLPHKKTLTIINGDEIPGNIPQKYILPVTHGRLKFIYAGTLNKGREIEGMINAFLKTSCDLILVGSQGEWIKSNYTHVNNIFYLGMIDVEAVRLLIRDCDVGVIPYPQNRMYYNIAYPTKLSSYITAGIPILSTPVSEVCKVLDAHPGIGVALDISEWFSWIENLSTHGLSEMKARIALIRQQFTWGNIIQPLELVLTQVNSTSDMRN